MVLTDEEIDALLPKITLKGMDPKQQVWLTKKDAIAFVRAAETAVIAKLRAGVEIEKLRKDAARYDWFADIAVSGDFERAEKAFNCFEFAESCTRQEIDAAIDAAIRKELTP